MKIKVKNFLSGVVFWMLVLAAVGLFVFVKKNVPDTLKINEVGFAMEDGVDWIEIYNPTLNNMSLEGFYLSDSAGDYSKFKIGEQLIVPSQGFVVVYCNGYAGEDEDAVVTNFRISNGETVYLVSANGKTVLDSMTVLAEDEEATGFSIGLFPDGRDELFIMSTPTPGEANQKDAVMMSEGFENVDTNPITNEN